MSHSPIRSIVAATLLLALFAVPAGAKPPSWDTAKPGSVRFKVLSAFGGQAVLDQETGLVWERSPSTDLVTWAYAQTVCFYKTTGNRMGWRLPAVEEMLSLIEPGVGLPAGHPFNFTNNYHWTSTTRSGTTIDTFIVLPDTPANILNWAQKSSGGISVWCVRGGVGHDGR